MNEIAADAATVIRVIPEYFKRIAIKPVQPILGAEPQKSFLILYRTYYCIVRQAVLHLVMPEIPGLPGSRQAEEQAVGKYDDPVFQSKRINVKL